jgi:hypothetical protein
MTCSVLTRSLLAALFALLVSACSSDEREPTPCERLHEHVAALSVRAAAPGDHDPATSAELEAHRALRARISQDRAVRSCESLSSSQVECGLRAESLDDYFACQE